MGSCWARVDHLMSALYRSSLRCSCLWGVRGDLISPREWRWETVLDWKKKNGPKELGKERFRKKKKKKKCCGKGKEGEKFSQSRECGISNNLVCCLQNCFPNCSLYIYIISIPGKYMVLLQESLSMKVWFTVCCIICKWDNWSGCQELPLHFHSRWSSWRPCAFVISQLRSRHP